MNKRKWIALVLSGGVMLQLASCASDLAYYAMNTFADYLPDLLDAVLESASA